jgi:xanthine dehydrogenase accessory factor
MLRFLNHLRQLVSSGRPFVTVTVVDVLASAPADVGSKMLVTSEGSSFGTIGGGPLEHKALAHARAMLAGESAGGAAVFVEWDLQSDLGMTCGGVVRLFFEAHNLASWPIVIFGAGHCCQALVRILLTLQCQITVVDPRDEWLARLPPDPVSPGKSRPTLATKPQPDYVAEIPVGAFVVLLTTGHVHDQAVLTEILRSRPTDFPYIGVIGSQAKASALRQGLLAAGIPPSALSRYHCPIGLPIGNNDPAEIAVSIAAQLLEQRDLLRAAPATDH